MAVEACYVVRDRVKTIIDMVGSPDTCDFFPGKYSAGKNQSFPWAIYTIVPDLDYNQPYISVDSMHIDLNHTSFGILQRMISAVLSDLNHENATDNTALYTAALAENIKLHDIVCRVHKVDSNDFIEGTDYYTVAIDILIQYVKLPANTSHQSYIEGT